MPGSDNIMPYEGGSYDHPILRKPVARNVRLITRHEAAKELLQAGLLRWRSGEVATYIAPGWVERGCFGILLED